MSTLTRENKIKLLARVEAEHSGRPEEHWDIIICAHEDVLVQLPNRDIDEYYAAVFGKEE